MQDRELVYVGDPMCSWCWGFAPVLDALRRSYRDTYGFRIMVGGLRPGPQAEALDERLKSFLRHEWQQIHQVTGQPFDFAFLDRPGFLYDTHPPACAVVTMRTMKPEAEHEFFNRLQRAFYAENTDITDPSAYPDLVRPFGVDATEFVRRMVSEEMNAAAENDYAEARRLGVTGFPTVLVRVGDQWSALTYGYQPFERLDAILKSVLDKGLL